MSAFCSFHDKDSHKNLTENSKSEKNGQIFDQCHFLAKLFALNAVFSNQMA